MEKNVTSLRVPGFLRGSCWALIIMLLTGFASRGQTTLSTTAAFTNDDSAGVVTFNFQNTNTYPVLLTQVAGVLGAYGSVNVELWYKTTGVSGAPGVIGTANGWTLAASGTVTGIANDADNATQPLFSNLNVSIPAGSTYAIAVAAYNGSGGVLRLDNAVAATSLNAGGCNLISGPGIGYAAYGSPAFTPTLNQHGFLGKLTFMPGNNCTGTPATPAISGPATVCASSLFSLSATGTSIGPGISYQWQYFNAASNTWVDIAGAITSVYTTNAGITTATQYRLRTTCAASGQQSLSGTLTVSAGSGLAGGTYTINDQAPSSPTNFISMSAAAAALYCGVTGSVTFNVAPGSGPYTEQVLFRHIPGASALNRVRFNGNGAIVQYENTNAERDIIHISGSDYLTLDSFKIRSLSTNTGYGISFSDSAYYDSITHCALDMSSISISGAASGGIALRNNTNSTTFYDSASVAFCYIGHNHIYGANSGTGPYFGILLGYNNVYNSNMDTGNVIAYNEIENFSNYGIYGSSNGSVDILYNDIHRKNRLQYGYFMGIYLWDGWNNNTSAPNSSSHVRIIGNRVHDPVAPSVSGSSIAAFFCGIQVANNWSYTSNNSYQRNILVANNAIYNVRYGTTSSAGNTYGIVSHGGYNTLNNNPQHIYIYHNTVSIDDLGNTSGTVHGIWAYDAYNTNGVNQVLVKNNLVTIRGQSAAVQYGFMYSDNLNNSNTFVEAQRNNFYLSTTGSGIQYYGSYLGTTYTNMAAFQAAYPALESGSLSVDPLYANAASGDLSPQNALLFNNGLNLLASVPKDINGRTRSTAPTPGAFEVGADAGVSALAAPLGTYCSSVKQVSVSIINAGLIPINTVQVHWSLNNVVQTPVTYSSTLAPGASAVVTLGNGLFLPNTPVTIKAWTSLPNGQPDALPYNDTLVVTTQSSTSVPVNLGADDTVCTGNTVTLDAGYPGALHVWDNNTTAQTRTISAAGTYYVRVTALDGCIGVDTYKLHLRPLPVVDLGPDREICLYEPTTMDAGNPGATYLWDDGSTGQTRTVDSSGYFEVQVTDMYGCTGVGNIEVTLKDIPGVDGINATHADSGTYTFYPINPRYANSYTWDFGDGSPTVDGYFVQHTYTALGIYTVTLYMVGECTGLVIDQSRTVDVFSIRGGTTGIGDPANGGQLRIFPNPATGQLTIQVAGGEKLQRLRVHNILGQLVLDQAAEGTQERQLNVEAMASGMYTLQVETGKGTYVRKFEVRR